VQPLRPQASLFDVLGLPTTFFLDEKLLEDRFKDLNRKLHPDRFAQKDARERRLSLEWTTAVNDAYRTLREPPRRAAYLLKAHGVDVEKESGQSATQRLPPDFLETVLEDREALAEARAGKDLPRVRELGKAIAVRSAGVLEELTRTLREFESTGASARALLEKAGEKLAVLKYYGRFAEEVEAIEMEALE